VAIYRLVFVANTNALLPSLLAPFATLQSLFEEGDSALPLQLKQFGLVSCSLNLNQQTRVCCLLLVKTEEAVFPDDTERFVCENFPLDLLCLKTEKSEH